MTALIHSDSIETAKPFFEYFIKIFTFEKKDSTLDQQVEETKNLNLTEEFTPEDEFSSETDAEGNDELLSKDDECKIKSTLYYKKFVEIRKDVIKNSELTDEDNPFYSEKFCNYLFNFLLAYFAIWSAVGIKRYGLLRDSNATAENGFKILKHQVLHKESNIVIPRFCQQNEVIEQGKLKEREFPLTTTRQEKNEKKETDGNVKTRRGKKRKYIEKSETDHVTQVER